MFELVMVVIVALIFDFTNGFHDAANAIATSVATKAISPRLAVVFAGILNFAGAFISIKVAATIGKGLIQQGSITVAAILAGLTGAICWNLFTWWRGWPTSSSHALIGGVAGSAIVTTVGFDVVKWSALVEKVIKPSVFAPIMAFVIAGALSLFLSGRLGRALDGRPKELRGLQLLSAGFVALTHGTNDAQKTMGVIVLALMTHGSLTEFSVPLWVMITAATAIALGTYVGGWRIVATLGHRLTDLNPRRGLAAQSTAAGILWGTAHYGFPVSTTHTITGAVLGTGSSRGWRDTKWGLAGLIAIAWVITLPGAALAGGAFALLLKVPGGSAILTCLVAVAAGAMVWQRRRFFHGLEHELDRVPTVSVPATAVAEPLATG